MVEQREMLTIAWNHIELGPIFVLAYSVVFLISVPVFFLCNNNDCPLAYLTSGWDQKIGS